ncbi:MAG: lipopolysaccharide biosynthesis protein, partial [Promethearchaeota archaeon]
IKNTRTQFRNWIENNMKPKDQASIGENFFKAIGVDRINQLVKDNVGLVYTTIGGFGPSVLGAFFWLIVASILNVNDYGLANYYLAIANVTAGVGIIGLNLTLITYLAKGEKKLLYEANSLTLITGTVSALALSAFYWVSGIIAATAIFFNMTQSELLGAKKYHKYALISIGQSIAQVTLSFLLYYPLGIIGILLGYFLGYLVFSYRYFYSTIKNFSLNFDSLKEKRNFALHSYGYNLIGQQLANYFDKVIIGVLFGYYILGLYQLGFQFFMFLTIIPASLSQYLLPEESSGKRKKEIKIIGLILSIAVAITAYIATPYLIQNLFPTFIDSIPLIQVMSLAIVPTTIVAILNTSRLGKEKSRTVFIAGLIYLSSLIIALITLEKIMGILGLALSLILARTIQAVYLVIAKE